MRPDFYTLDVPLAPGTGTPKPVSDCIEHAVQVVGTFTGSLKIEATLDGTNWSDFSAAITTPGFTTLARHPIKSIRVNLTALSSGAPVVNYVGLNARAT